MSETYYQSGYTGLQIDHALGRIVNGELDKLAAGATDAAAAAQSALSGVQKAIKNIPEGDTPIVNDLTTGGATSALSAEQGKVLGQRPNPNLLDNWYFLDPINQRGQTEYIGGYRGLIDRWRGAYDSDYMILDDSGMSFSNGRSEGSTYLRQHLPSALPAGTYTLSALVTGIGGDSNVSMYFANDSGVSLGLVKLTGLGLVSVTRTLEEGVCSRVQFTLPYGTTMALAAIKLELGSVQTLAHQDADGNWVLNDPPPNKTLEMEKCRRYFERITNNCSTNRLALGIGIGTATKLYVPMRISPKRAAPAAFAEDLAANFLYGTSDMASVPTAVSVFSADWETGNIMLCLTGTFSEGVAYRVGLAPGARLDFDANL